MSVQIQPFIRSTDCKITLSEVIHRIDGEHHHIEDVHIQHFVCKFRCMRRQTDIFHNALRSQVHDIVQDSVLFVSVKIGFFIQTVDKTDIDIVCLEVFKLPVDRLFDLVKTDCPAVFSCCIVCSEMYLQHGFFPALCHYFAVSREDRRMSSCHVKIIDSCIQCILYCPDDVCFFLLSYNG